MDVTLDSADVDDVLAHPLVAGLLATTSDAAVVIDARDRRILAVNPRARELLGLGEGAIGCDCSSTLDSPVCFQACPLTRAVGGLPAPPVQALYYRRAGGRIPARTRMLVLRGPDGVAVAGIELIEDRREVHDLQLALRARRSLHGLAGRSVAMQALYTRVDALGPTDLPVLVSGPAGTGKRRVAAALHQASLRADRSLHRIELRGTPPATHRPHLARLLHEHPGDSVLLAGAEALDPATAGWIADLATGRGPDPGVRLLFTLRSPDALPAPLDALLGPTTVEVPALAARLDDLPLLAESILGERAALDGREPPGVDPDAFALLADRPWADNVAELERVLHAALLHLPRDGRLDAAAVGRALAVSPPPTLASLEADAIARAMAATDGNVSAAARMLGIDRTTLWRKLRRQGD